MLVKCALKSTLLKQTLILFTRIRCKKNVNCILMLEYDKVFQEQGRKQCYVHEQPHNDYKKTAHHYL